MAENKEVNLVLGENIKNIRKKNSITREYLAELIGVSPRFLADVEGGKVGVSISTLKKICKALNVSSDYLLGLTFSDEREI
ncbi:MAG: helix-turn-helix domain-containing protein, partial [Lachnospirales bacterium]